MPRIKRAASTAATSRPIVFSHSGMFKRVGDVTEKVRAQVGARDGTVGQLFYLPAKLGGRASAACLHGADGREVDAGQHLHVAHGLSVGHAPDEERVGGGRPGTLPT